MDPGPDLRLLGQVKTRPYLANIRISRHSQDKKKSRVTFFCKFLALLCFELLGFENPIGQIGPRAIGARVNN